MSNLKFVEFDPRGGVGKAEVEGPEKFVRFMFEQFKPKRKGNRAELQTPDGQVLESKP